MRQWILAVSLAVALGSNVNGQVVGPAGGVRMDGHKVVRVDIRSVRDLQTALALTDDVWSHHLGIGGPLDIRVSPAQLETMRTTRLSFEVLIEDVQAQIDAEHARLQGGGDGPGWYDDYKTYDQFVAHMNDLATQYPTLASTFVVGQSLEGRSIMGLRVTGPGSVANRPAVFYNGGQHAREWVNPATTLYIGDELLSKYASNCQIKELVDNVEFLIVPIVNPDGYVYSWTPNNRLWRKNRRDNGAGCFGVDTNRNWGFQWGGQGASTNPCNDTYRGTAGFSEPETAAIRDYVTANPRIKIAVDFHSYGQLIMSPWGYTNALPPDHALFMQLNTAMQQAIAGFSGLSYTIGPIYTTIYPASGTSVDWYYGDRGILGFTIELRPVGSPGFVLPPEQIVPTAAENFQAIVALSSYLLNGVQFTLPSGTPATVPSGTPSTVQVKIDNASGTFQSGTGRILTRVGTSGPFTPSALTPVGGSIFEGTLPAAPCNATIQFYFDAMTTAGQTVTYPSTCGVAQPLSTTAVSQVLAFADNFESNLGWTVQNHVSLTAGAWVRVDPIGTMNGSVPAQPEDDYTPNPGVNCYVTGQGVVGGALGAADVDGGPTWLISPTIDLSGATGAAVQYARWLYCSTGEDKMTIDVSNNNGTTWVPAGDTSNTSGWKVATLNIHDFVPLTAQVRLRFGVADQPNNSITEGAIDDLQVFKLQCPAVCYADCNGDGLLDLADFGCFQTKFATGNAYADCNGDTLLDLADFGCFLTKFAIGCP